MKKSFAVALLLSSCAIGRAQEQATAETQKEFHAASVPLQEKIFVRTDKTVYLAGETVWFSIYTLLEQSPQLSPISRVAYVELSRSGSAQAVQEKIALDSGLGSGSLQVPAGWPSGNYSLRAYTSWMKNFPEAAFYTRTLSVISPVYGPVARKDSLGAAPAVATATIAKTKTRTGDPPAALQFFPEGGTLIRGVETKIAFKCTDVSGRGKSCSGFVVNQKKDTLARFQSAPDSQPAGAGHFNISITPGDSLFAYDNSDGNPVRVTFPSPENTGYAMRLSGVTGAALIFNVHAPSTENNRLVYLLAFGHKALKSIQSVPVQNGLAQFTVDRTLLSEGVSVFTVFDPNRRPVCERLFFTAPQSPLLQVSVAQPRYNTRSAVSVDLSAADRNGKGIGGTLSLSAIRLDRLQGLDGENILTWYYLTSELRGKIENPSIYLTNAGDKAAAIDDLMLTQGWRHFPDNKSFQNGPVGFEFLPEEEGPMLSATAVNRTTSQPAAGVSFLLSFPGRHFQFSTATADKNGHLLFTAPPFAGTNLGVILPANPADSGYRVEADPAYSDRPFPPAPEAAVLLKESGADIASRALALQVENAYRPEEKRKFLAAAATDSVAFYGRPDRAYHLADYTRFPTMEEILREFVEDVRVRKDGRHFRFRVMNLLFKTFLDEDPLILLDGVPVSDPDKIMQLDPAKLNDIDVISHRFYKGSVVFPGVISFRSLTGDLGQTNLDPAAVAIDFEGLQQQREFYSPVYADPGMQQRPIPDYRTTIAWMPGVHTSADGKQQVRFFSSDLPGRYAVIAEGITVDGKPLSGISSFEVEAKK